MILPNPARSNGWLVWESRLRHDWLKHEYIPLVDEMVTDLTVAELRTLAPERLRRLGGSWRQGEAQLLELVSESESALCPKHLLAEGALAKLSTDDKVWIGALLTTMWMGRTLFLQKVNELRTVLEGSRKSLASIVSPCESRQDGARPDLLPSLIEHRRQLVVLAEAMRNLRECE